MLFCSVPGCNYPNFSKDKTTGKGFCKNHQSKRSDLDKRSIVQKAMSKQQKTKVRSLRSLPDNTEMIEQNAALKEWFRYHELNSARICENCGADLNGYNDKDWHGCQDHIIEKSNVNGCPSVAAVLENHCVLGKWCGCHGQKHTSNLNLSKMPIFPVLKERFKKFEHLILPEEKRKVPEIFYK